MLARRLREDRLRRRHHGRERALRAAPVGRDRRAAHRLPGAAGVRLGLHRADRRRGGLERRAGLPAAQEPQRRGHAARSWALLAITMFAGITALAIASHVHMAEDTGADRLPRRDAAHGAQPDRARDVRRRRCRSSCSRASPRRSSILAANTAFNGFPVLSSLLGRDGYLPHQLAHRGDRLVFSNGIVAAGRLAGAADRRLQRRRHAADPALHPRRLPLVHAQPGGDGAALGRRCAAQRAGERRALRRKQARQRDSAPSPPGSCS